MINLCWFFSFASLMEVAQLFWIVLFSSVNKLLFELAQPKLALFLNYCVVAATFAFAFCSLVAKLALWV